MTNLQTFYHTLAEDDIGTYSKVKLLTKPQITGIDNSKFDKNSTEPFMSHTVILSLIKAIAGSETLFELPSNFFNVGKFYFNLKELDGIYVLYSKTVPKRFAGLVLTLKFNSKEFFIPLIPVSDSSLDFSFAKKSFVPQFKIGERMKSYDKLDAALIELSAFINEDCENFIYLTNMRHNPLCGYEYIVHDLDISQMFSDFEVLPLTISDGLRKDFYKALLVSIVTANKKTSFFNLVMSSYIKANKAVYEISSRKYQYNLFYAAL